VASSPDGSKVYVTGYTVGIGGDEDATTFAYDASTGAQLWAASYNDPSNGNDLSLSVAPSPDGSKVFIAGSSGGTGNLLGYLTIAYDATTGARLWAQIYHGPGDGNGAAYAVAVSPGGAKVFVTGFSDGVSSGPDYATVAYDAGTGVQLWVRRYDGPGDFWDYANALSVSPGGSRVFVTGQSYPHSGGFSDYATVAYSSSGAQLWVRRFHASGTGDNRANSVAVSPGGSTLFVTGTASAAGGQAGITTVAYSASTGARQWVGFFDTPGGCTGDDGRAVGVSPDGSKVFVTGTTDGGGCSDYSTVAYDAMTGAQLWASQYDGPGDSYDNAFALAVSPGGQKVFVTGYGVGDTGSYDYGTVAYDAATGAQLWVARYNGPVDGTDVPRSIAVSPGGSKVFVTGQSPGTGGDDDFLTVAYAA